LSIKKLSKKIKYKKIKWTIEYDLILLKAADDREDLVYVKEQVLNGVAELWKFKSENKSLHMVLRKDSEKELCIVLCVGDGLREIGPQIFSFLKNKNIILRAHVKRKGMIRILNGLGFNVSEIVMRA